MFFTKLIYSTWLFIKELGFKMDFHLNFWYHLSTLNSNVAVLYLLLIQSNQHPINSVPFTLESVHNFHPSSLICPSLLSLLNYIIFSSPFGLLGLSWSTCVLCVWVLAQRTVWQRCRWIFDLLRDHSVSLSLQSLADWADWWGLFA